MASLFTVTSPAATPTAFSNSLTAQLTARAATKSIKSVGKASGTQRGVFSRNRAGLMISAAADCHEALMNRRSVAKYTKEAVPKEVMDRAFAAAVMAPNHFMTEPWRFRVAGPETLEKICTLNEDKRKMFEGVPGWIIVSVATELDESGAKPAQRALEDNAATSCAIQNLCLSLYADGVGSKWMTGALGIAPDAMLEAVGASAEEQYMGVVWYGYADMKGKAPPRKAGVDGVVSYLS